MTYLLTEARARDMAAYLDIVLAGVVVRPGTTTTRHVVRKYGPMDNEHGVVRMWRYDSNPNLGEFCSGFIWFTSELDDSWYDMDLGGPGFHIHEDPTHVVFHSSGAG
jgi:hypothetical protein